MILHYQVVFWTPKDTFENVKALLKDKYRLVAPTIADAERLDRQLVWEDEQGIGRFRVNFSYGQKIMRKDIFNSGEARFVRRTDEGAQPNIIFRYWSRRLDASALNNDPMLHPYLDVYRLLKPVKVTEFDSIDISTSLEKLLI
jgi:hypothetical protein